ncbi:MAG: hypothetical protein WC530_11155 [Candidatus Omnitrophota bacterium]
MDKKKININREVSKITVILLLLALNWTGLSLVGKTLSSYFDKEASLNNLYEAGILDFYLEYDKEFSLQNLTPCFTATKTVELKKNGNPFQYSLKAENLSGTLCGNLELTAWRNAFQEYSGSLAGLDLSAFEFQEPDVWDFEISLDGGDPSLQNKSCQFDLSFRSWQTNIADFSIGFSDIEVLSDSAETKSWMPEVEVLYPDGGETWYLVPPALARPGLGMYDITWEASSPVYQDSDLLIDIWFCKDSGANCFWQIANDTENDGVHTWTIPYMYDFITDEARIEIIAVDPCGMEAEDQSDTDFCPPMLSSEDVEKMLLSMELSGEEEPLFEISSQEPVLQEPIEPVETSTQPADGLEGDFEEEETEDSETEDEEEQEVEFVLEEALIQTTLPDPIEVATPESDGVEEQ